MLNVIFPITDNTSLIYLQKSWIIIWRRSFSLYFRTVTRVKGSLFLLLRPCFTNNHQAFFHVVALACTCKICFFLSVTMELIGIIKRVVSSICIFIFITPLILHLWKNVQLMCMNVTPKKCLKTSEVMFLLFQLILSFFHFLGWQHTKNWHWVR